MTRSIAIPVLFAALAASPTFGENLLLNGSFESIAPAGGAAPRHWSTMGDMAPLSFVGDHRDGATAGLLTGDGRERCWRQIETPTGAIAGRLGLSIWATASDVTLNQGDFARVVVRCHYKGRVDPTTITLDLPPGTWAWRRLVAVVDVDPSLGEIDRLDTTIAGKFAGGQIVVDKIELSAEAAMSPVELLTRKIKDLDANLAGVEADASVAAARAHLAGATRAIATPDGLSHATDEWVAAARAVSPAAWARAFPDACATRPVEARMIFHGGQGATRAEVDASLDVLQSAGANGTFHSAGSWISTIYPSTVIPSAPPEFDALGYAIESGKRRGIRSYAYLATLAGVAAPPSGPGSLYEGHPDWFAKGPDPRMPTFPDPANPEVVAWIARAYVELATKYDLDGIGLDYIRYPTATALNYDTNNRRQLRERFGVDLNSIEAARDPEKWKKIREYRAETITNLVRAVRDAVKAARPDVTFVGCLMAEPDVALEYGQDWQQLAPLFDVVVPMNYDDRSRDDTLLASQRRLLAGGTRDVPAIGGMPEVHDAWPISRWAQCIATQRRAGVDGLIVYRMSGLDPAIAAFLGNGAFHDRATFPPPKPRD